MLLCYNRNGTKVPENSKPGVTRGRKALARGGVPQMRNTGPNPCYRRGKAGRVAEGKR